MFPTTKVIFDKISGISERVSNEIYYTTLGFDETNNVGENRQLHDFNHDTQDVDINKLSFVYSGPHFKILNPRA